MRINDEYNGLKIECNSSLSYIGFYADWMESPDGWFFQGDEADEVMEAIQNIADSDNISDTEAAAKWSNLYLY